MYKMVVEITKNKWESCGIKAINYYIEEKIVTELWLEMLLWNRDRAFKY